MEIMKKLADRIIMRCLDRDAHEVIGGVDDPYLLRWTLLPKNRFCNIFLHLFLRSDDDRALHDHPWANCSVVLQGSYTEHTIEAGGIHTRAVRHAGDVVIRASGRLAHRIELTHGPCWTLFITGPKYRDWGFHCPEQGWIPWRRFCDEKDEGAVGKGCEG